MKSLWDSLWHNRQWVFSGIGVFVIGGIIWVVRHFFGRLRTRIRSGQIRSRDRARSVDSPVMLHEVRFDYLPDSPLENGWTKVSDGDENPTFSRDPEMPGSLLMQANGKVFA